MTRQKSLLAPESALYERDFVDLVLEAGLLRFYLSLLQLVPKRLILSSVFPLFSCFFRIASAFFFDSMERVYDVKKFLALFFHLSVPPIRVPPWEKYFWLFPGATFLTKPIIRRPRTKPPSQEEDAVATST